MSADPAPRGIRRCGPQDAAALALVGAATFLETYAWMIAGDDIVAHVRERHDAASYAAFLADPHCALWIAEADRGAAIGFALLTPPDLPVETGPADAELRRIYLLSRYQGGGAGKRLFAAVADEASARGKKRLLIGVAKQNEKAIAFYQRQGAAIIGERAFRVGDETFEDFVLALAL